MGLIIGEVLCAKSEDSFVSVNAWGVFRVSHAINIFIWCTWLQNDVINLTGIGASVHWPNRCANRVSEIKILSHFRLVYEAAFPQITSKDNSDPRTLRRL